MPLFRLFHRLMVRPLLREPARTALTVFAIALGVAVVVAIDLAGDAATGSFHSSMESLAGASDLEITASGGIPDSVAGVVAALPYDLRISPRVEDFAVLADTRQTLPLIGLDLVGDPGALAGARSYEPSSQSGIAGAFQTLNDPASIWVGASLHRRPGDHLALLINDHAGDYVVRGVYPDSGGDDSAIVMDIAAAQRAVSRVGRIDRILLQVPPAPALEEWQQRL